jgi:hypothetical protein
VEVSWADRDRYSRLAPIVLGCGLGAIMLALFGLPPVDLHSPLHWLGIMDPLCGMTRAVRLFAGGDLVDAARYNPAVFALALAAGGILTRSAIGHARGRWLEISVHRSRATTWLVAGAIGLLWVNQQLNAARLR